MAQTGTGKKGVTIGMGSTADTEPYIKDEVFTSEETTNQLRVSEEDFYRGL